MKKILIVMLMLLSVFALSAAPSDSVEVGLTLGNGEDDQRLFKMGFTTDTTVSSLESTPKDYGENLTLKLNKDTFIAEQNNLYIWYKNVGYENVQIQLTCEEALTNFDVEENDVKYIQWQAVSGGVTVTSTTDATKGVDQTETVINITDGKASVDTQQVTISTISIPTGATGTYQGTLTLSVVGVE